jgi:hypothetical protein
MSVGGYAPVIAVIPAGCRSRRRNCSRSLTPRSAGRAKIGYQSGPCAFPDGGNAGSQGGLAVEGAGDGHNGAVRGKEAKPEKRILVNKRFELTGHDKSFRSAGPCQEAPLPPAGQGESLPLIPAGLVERVVIGVTGCTKESRR